MSSQEEKPFCSLCEHSYSSQAKLKRHIIEVHQHVKGFRCSFCPKEFIRKENLERHSLQIHSLEALKDDRLTNDIIIRRLTKGEVLSSHTMKKIVKKKFPQCYETLIGPNSVLEVLKVLQSRSLHISDVIDIEKMKGDMESASMDEEEESPKTKSEATEAQVPKQPTDSNSHSSDDSRGLEGKSFVPIAPPGTPEQRSEEYFGGYKAPLILNFQKSPPTEEVASATCNAPPPFPGELFRPSPPFVTTVEGTPIDFPFKPNPPNVQTDFFSQPTPPFLEPTQFQEPPVFSPSYASLTPVPGCLPPAVFYPPPYPAYPPMMSHGDFRRYPPPVPVPAYPVPPMIPYQRSRVPSVGYPPVYFQGGIRRPRHGSYYYGPYSGPSYYSQ